jgi:Ni,Fe-hydrogenase I large subunit
VTDLDSDLQVTHFWFTNELQMPNDESPTNECIESESESYIMTDDQSASLSWNKAPIWSLRPDI